MQREKETERKKERERDRRDFLIDIERTRSEQRLDRVKNIRVEGREKEGDGNEEAREESTKGGKKQVNAQWKRIFEREFSLRTSVQLYRTRVFRSTYECGGATS